MSFWGLNPLVKKGEEKTPEHGDIQKLRRANVAEKSYDVLYPKQFNKHKQDDPLSQQSLLWAISSCQWKDVLVSGLFALLKISFTVLLLNISILTADGKLGFRYEGYLFALALWYFRSRLIGLKVRSMLAGAIYKKQQELSNAGGSMHSGREMINYAGAGAHRNGEFLFWFQPKWTPSFPLCISLIVLFRAVGLAIFAALTIVIITVLCNTPVAKLQRILKFLEAPKLQSRKSHQKFDEQNMNQPIFIRSANFSWEDNPSKPALKNVSLEVRPGEKVAVCGEVSSGKSTLIAAILGQVPRTRGTVQVSGRVAYVSQAAWIQNGTILDNILLGSAMDCGRYHDALERCSLLNDLESLPCGDLTEIGERGVKLTDDVKQRIQLARALYQDADIYLLDDPFRAMDAETTKCLFNEYIMGALARKTVLLVTHQVDFLSAFHSVLFVSGGQIQQQASYHQLLSSSQAFQELVNVHEETDGSERLAEATAQKRGSSEGGDEEELCRVKT